MTWPTDEFVLDLALGGFRPENICAPRRNGRGLQSVFLTECAVSHELESLREPFDRLLVQAPPAGGYVCPTELK